MFRSVTTSTWVESSQFEFHAPLLDRAEARGDLRHRAPPPIYRPAALPTARRVSTFARWLRYSADAVTSSLGDVPSAALSHAADSASMLASEPASACSTACARSGVDPMLVSATRASAMPPLSRRTAAATPTIAQACATRLNFS